MPTDHTTIIVLLPEITLVVLAVWIFVGGTFTRTRLGWGVVALATFMLVAVALFRQDLALRSAWSLLQHGQLTAYTASVTSGPLTVDAMGQTFRLAAVLFGVLYLLTALRRGGAELSGEYLGSLILVFVGLMLTCVAADLVLLFLGLELVSIPTFVLLFLGRRDAASAEATTKYFFLSVLSTALLLYGFSFLYGATGSVNLLAIRNSLLAAGTEGAATGGLSLTSVAVVLVVAGLGFKIAAVPFHFYAPDVYQGTTNANAGLLAVVPKIAGIVALVRLLVLAMPTETAFSWQVALALSLLTMTLGNVCALWQNNLRRLMAYSSIAHAGYLLIGLAVGLAAAGSEAGAGGIAAMLFYLLVYGVATLGTFAALAYLSGPDHEVSDLDELAGLARTRPVIAGAIAVFMFSLAGIPPLAGFWGKLLLLASALGLGWEAGSSAIGGWFLLLAVAAAVNAAIAAAYYLRVVARLYFYATPATTAAPGGGAAGLAAVVCAVLIVAGGILQGPLVGRTYDAGRPAAVKLEIHSNWQPLMNADER